MTVSEIIRILKEFPSDSVVTDVYGNELLNIEYEPSEYNPDILEVWFEINI